jgi:hypothetical protein
VLEMRMNGKERRILREIEEALAREDPQFAQRIAAINRIEGADAMAYPEAGNHRAGSQIKHRLQLLFLAVLTVVTVMAVLVLVRFTG